MKLSTEIEVGIIVPGFHFWADAPENIAWLNKLHHHAFIIKVRLLVDHPDRAIEFFEFQSKMRETLTSLYLLGTHGYCFGGESCETIAAKLLVKLTDQSFPVMSVSVHEDLNGAIVRIGA